MRKMPRPVACDKWSTLLNFIAEVPRQAIQKKGGSPKLGTPRERRAIHVPACMILIIGTSPHVDLAGLSVAFRSGNVPIYESTLYRLPVDAWYNITHFQRNISFVVSA